MILEYRAGHNFGTALLVAGVEPVRDALGRRSHAFENSRVTVRASRELN